VIQDTKAPSDTRTVENERNRRFELAPEQRLARRDRHTAVADFIPLPSGFFPCVTTKKPFFVFLYTRRSSRSHPTRPSLRSCFSPPLSPRFLSRSTFFQKKCHQRSFSYTAYGKPKLPQDEVKRTTTHNGRMASFATPPPFVIGLRSFLPELNSTRRAQRTLNAPRYHRSSTVPLCRVPSPSIIVSQC